MKRYDFRGTIHITIHFVRYVPHKICPWLQALTLWYVYYATKRLGILVCWYIGLAGTHSLCLQHLVNVYCDMILVWHVFNLSSCLPWWIHDDISHNKINKEHCLQRLCTANTDFYVIQSFVAIFHTYTSSKYYMLVKKCLLFPKKITLLLWVFPVYTLRASWRHVSINYYLLKFLVSSSCFTHWKG